MTIVVEQAKNTRHCHKCEKEIKKNKRCVRISKRGYPHPTIINICGSCIMDIGRELLTKDKEGGIESV